MLLNYLADKFDILPFNVLNNHDFHFIEKMKSQFTHGISVNIATYKMKSQSNQIDSQ